MASKERVLRLKEDTRHNILNAAYKIVKEEGWQALSMRKIADEIEYTAPIIYEYFANKEALLMELTRKGFQILTKDLQDAKAKHRLPAKQLEAMWLAYWNFAFAKTELYQLMFGVEMNCCEQNTVIPESEEPFNLISSVIQEIMQINDPEDERVCTKYYTFWSVVHGLISINIINIARRGNSDEINKHILQDAITAIIKSLTA